MSNTESKTQTNRRLSPTSKDDYHMTYPVQTRWGDNDLYGHVNNVTYYAYFDSVINRFLVEKGGLDIHAGNKIGFIVDSRCAYFSPIAYPDELECGFKVTRLGNSSVDYELAIFKPDQLLSSATGGMTHVFVDRNTQKPSPIGGQLLDALKSAYI